ncbi:LapA family protein [Patescibacteria group bacterium]|nr:LapA family protein [Patescibacteria group bacterium]MBU4367689.1 LapA family protein [Patescibacteria group bacterium]MBU4461861.1 LapA family protein [Patescibacteria group bacterium]MCG2700008.1 LapA family protein [Candidatus Parcubacteria bacterium]
MLLFVIVILVVAILAVIFALQNVNIIFVNFLIWKLEGSLSLILLLTFVLGFIVGLLVLSPKLLKRKSDIVGRKEDSKGMQEKTEVNNLTDR